MANLAITAANVIASATSLKGAGTAGAAVTRGQPLYIDATDGNKLKPADANVSLALATVVGIALNDAAAGQPVNYVFSDSDFQSGGAMAVGAVYVLSATAGGIADVADLATGMFPVVLMVAKSATKAVLSIVAGGVVTP